MQQASQMELGKYTLIGEIARGGMGIVYLAQVQGPGGFKKSVVVKELKQELADDPKFREMFLEEANLAARLNHRNIVQTNEVGQDGDRYYMAMDYLEGCSLHTARKRLQGDSQLPVPLQLRVVTEVLAGLHYAHELTDYDGTPMGVVHRDVGPQNIFLTYDGQVKLIDFGVAKVLNRQQETQAGVLKGRVAYMAPEQVAGGAVDRRVDIFATGLVLREIVTGQRVWEGLGEIDTLKKLITKDIPAFPDAPGVAPELRAICEKAMAPNRDDRFKTAHEMRVALEQYVARTYPSGSLADLGAHLAREFVQERKRLKDILDGHLGASVSGRIATVDLPSSSPDLFSSLSSASRLSGPRSETPAPSGRVSKTPAPASAGTLVSGELPEIDVAVDTSAMQGRTRSWIGRVAGGFALVAVAVLTITFVRRGHESRAPAEPTAPVAKVETPPPVPAAVSAAPSEPRDDTVEVTVRVTPPSALIFVDDAPVDGNPFHARFPRSAGATHAIRAVAGGYVQKTELVKFDANANVAMSLERQPTYVQAAQPPKAEKAPPVVAAATSVAPPAPPAKTGDINPRGGKAPKRDIDPKNPYGTE